MISEIIDLALITIILLFIGEVALRGMKCYLDSTEAYCIKQLALKMQECEELKAKNNCLNCEYKLHSEAVSKLPSCNDCERQKECCFRSQLGDWCRINCPHHEKRG